MFQSSLDFDSLSCSEEFGADPRSALVLELGTAGLTLMGSL